MCAESHKQVIGLILLSNRESYYQLIIDRRETIPDTGGAGSHRGGNGVDVAHCFPDAGTIGQFRGFRLA